MEQEKHTPSGERLAIVRGADDQLSALEQLWAQGDGANPRADDEAWQMPRRALHETRRQDGARLLFGDA